MKGLKFQRTNNYLTVQEAFDEYQRYNARRNLAEQTLIHKEQHIKRFYEFIDDDNFLIKDVTKNVVDDFTYYLMKDDIKAVTVNTYIRNLRAFIYWSSDNDYVEKFKITMLKTDDEIKETYSETQLKALLEKPDIKNCSFVEYRTWVLENYLLSTGNRLGTIINLKICDIDFENELVSLRTVKNRKQQIVPLSNSICKILKEYLSYRGGEPDDYLFINTYGSQLTKGAFTKSIEKYNLDRGVNITSIHSFRHTFAKFYIKNGGDVFRLQKLMGHSDISITRIYVNLFAEDIKEGYEDINPLNTILNKNKKEHVTMKRK